MTLPFATSIMNNFKMSKEQRGVKQNKQQQQFPINNLSSDVDLENFSKESYEQDNAGKVKHKSFRNNKKIIGFSWSTITNNQKGKTTTSHNTKVI